MSLLEEVKRAAEVVTKGGLILYPTDTVWAIGCDATSDAAVRRLVELKGRTTDKGLIALLDVPSRLASYVKEIPAVAWDLIEYSEKPLTIVYDQPMSLAASLFAKDGSVALRITRDEFCRLLIGRIRKPLVSSSANTSGQDCPDRFSRIEPDILEGVDYVVNLRRNEIQHTPPSTVIRLKTNGEIRILRS